MSARVIMMPLRYCVILLAMILPALSGCSHHPVRHLASDVGLIKPGETTRQEALSLLGDPDSTRQVSATTEEWIYQEEDKSLGQKVPVVGGAFSSKGYKTVVLILNGNIVTAARYGAYEKAADDWKDDYTWQKIDSTPTAQPGAAAEGKSEPKTKAGQ
jgi:hypothetical protein